MVSCKVVKFVNTKKKGSSGCTQLLAGLIIALSNGGRTLQHMVQAYLLLGDNDATSFHESLPTLYGAPSLPTRECLSYKWVSPHATPASL